MTNGEIIEKITFIDEQIHDLRKMVLESGSRIKEKEWPKTAPAVLEMTKKDRRHNE